MVVFVLLPSCSGWKVSACHQSIDVNFVYSAVLFLQNYLLGLWTCRHHCCGGPPDITWSMYLHCHVMVSREGGGHSSFTLSQCILVVLANKELFYSLTQRNQRNRFNQWRVVDQCLHRHFFVAVSWTLLCAREICVKKHEFVVQLNAKGSSNLRVILCLCLTCRSAKCIVFSESVVQVKMYVIQDWNKITLP